VIKAEHHATCVNLCQLFTFYSYSVELTESIILIRPNGKISYSVQS